MHRVLQENLKCKVIPNVVHRRHKRRSRFLFVFMALIFLCLGTFVVCVTWFDLLEAKKSMEQPIANPPVTTAVNKGGGIPKNANPELKGIQIPTSTSVRTGEQTASNGPVTVKETSPFEVTNVAVVADDVAKSDRSKEEKVSTGGEGLILQTSTVKPRSETEADFEEKVASSLGTTSPLGVSTKTTDVDGKPILLDPHEKKIIETKESTLNSFSTTWTNSSTFSVTSDEKLDCRGFREGISKPSLHCAHGAANRAPLSSLLHAPLPPNKKEKESLHSATENPECFGSNGVSLARPMWVTPLMHSLVEMGNYNAVAEFLSENPWYILLGWVPESFMPTQKPGRRANGDMMIPQTKGKNASYYLEKYGSVWHTELRVVNITFHFQVLHRNAIAVCVRERIHLQQYFCTYNKDSKPIPVHACPCRHCRIPSDKIKKKVKLSSSPKVPLLVETPSAVHYLPKLPIAETHGEGTLACVNALSAPWLVNRSIMPLFPYEGKHNDLDAMLKTQADVHGIVTVVIFNSFWRDLLHNFVYSFNRRANLSNLIVATLDEASLLDCINDRLPCFNATTFAEQEDVRPPEQGVTRKVTEELSWVKPRLAIAVLRRGYGFLLSDLDITWNNNPYPFLLREDGLLLHQCDSSQQLSINSGFYLAKPSSQTLQFFVNIMSFRPDESSDQDAMRLFMRYDHTHGVSHRCLPKWIFNMKCNYKIQSSRVLVNGKETFVWHPYTEKQDFKWVLMHATCLSGAKNKVRYLKTIKTWFLDELDSITGSALSPQQFCIELPASINNVNGTSRIVANMTALTPHTTHYKEMTIDEIYLKKRY